MQSDPDRNYGYQGDTGQTTGMGMGMGMGEGATSNIPMGAHVFTSDGDDLGTVGEMRGGHFKVQASMAPDYWVNLNHVTSVMSDRVTLNFAKDDLDEYKDDEPNQNMEERRAA